MKKRTQYCYLVPLIALREEMNSEINRLNTFSQWPTSAPVDPPNLARGGFFYTGEGTEVQCFSCNAKISNWNYGDQVMARHRIIEPQCTYVAHPSLSGNVTLSEAPSSPSRNEEVQDQPSEEPYAIVTRSTSDYGLTEDDEMYRSDALRLLSFINWEVRSYLRNRHFVLKPNSMQNVRKQINHALN